MDIVTRHLPEMGAEQDPERSGAEVRLYLTGAGSGFDFLK